MLKVDFSNIAIDLRNFAIELFEHKKVFKFDEQNNQLLDHSERDFAGRLLQGNRVAILEFWFNISLGIEILTKAVLLHHEISIFLHKDIRRKIATIGSLQVKAAYEGFYEGIVTPTNTWLSAEFQRLRIERIDQLSTPTLGKLAINYIPLLAPRTISDQEANLLSEQIAALADLRRNRDFHFYFKSMVLFD